MRARSNRIQEEGREDAVVEHLGYYRKEAVRRAEEYKSYSREEKKKKNKRGERKE